LKFRFLFFIAFSFLTLADLYAQELYSIGLLPKDLIQGANAVLHSEEIIVTIEDYNKVHVSEKKAVTILNKNGETHREFYKFYDSSEDIKKIEANVYDASGKHLKKYRKKDFIDISASGGNLYSDNRVKYIDYTPVKYPYTFEIIVEYRTTSTAFLPRWQPMTDFYLAIQQSDFIVNNPKGLKLNTKKYNFEGFFIEDKSEANKIHLSARHVKALPFEYKSPQKHTIFPRFLVSLEKFQLVNTPAEVTTWDDFGLWQNNTLLYGKTTLPQTTIQQVNELCADTDDPLEKARRIYEFMQQKTRYISVQIGIGGWQPTPAQEVDKLGYGDCKGLTNYTKALLESQGITSYYTIVYGDPHKRDIDEEVVTLQGNHVILTLPTEEDYYFLECTSQDVPFGFVGNFTDDRKVLMVTPNGGEIVKTTKYTAEDSFQKASAKYKILDNGHAEAQIELLTGGVQYDDRRVLDSKNEKQIKEYYHNYWRFLHNLDVKSVLHNNNKAAVTYKQEVVFTTTNYTTTAGNDLIFSLNMFNRFSAIPTRYSNRRLPFEISRAFQDIDEVEIEIPQGYEITSLPEAVELKGKFGTYKVEAEKLHNNKILYKRVLMMNEGVFSKDDYEDYREFIREIVKLDNSKAVATKL
jgi:transglutaminase-like putative cysteine protease